MNILLVRLSSMGDLVHTLPAISDLARHRSDIQLDWLCEAAFADIARLHPFVRHVHTLTWRQWRKNLFQAATYQQIVALKHHLQIQNYQQVIDSQGLIKSAVFARFAGVPIKGFDKYSARESWAAYAYQQHYAVKKGEDAVWRNRQLFAQAFNYDCEGIADFGVKIPHSGSLNDLPAHYYVALHASSRDSKLWPVDHWRSLLIRLHDRDGASVLLPWGNEIERVRATKIARDFSFAQVCPPLSLLQAAFLLQKSHAVVGVDTGLLHLANAVNRPLVAIYTDSDPHKTGTQILPWTKNLGGIGQVPEVETVYQAVLDVTERFSHA